MVKLLERGVKLSGTIAWILVAILAAATAVTWLAARDAITFVAPIIMVERSEWIFTKHAELRRDRTMAGNEARMSDLETARAQTHLNVEARYHAATLRQIERGLIHPATLGDGKFSAFPAAVAKHIDQGAVPLLEAPKLPARVDLDQLMSDRPSLNNLILGITYDNQVVTESLKSLTHIAVAGVTRFGKSIFTVTRFGKSIFTQQLLYQIATAKEDTALYLADLGGTTFVDFGLPYASTLAETEAMIADVMSEAEHRKALYEATGRGIRSLDIYNEVTGDNLPWIVMIEIQNS
jgi:hypothetical protein